MERIILIDLGVSKLLCLIVEWVGVKLIIYLIIGGVLINNYTSLWDGFQVITLNCGGLPNNFNLIMGGVTK